MRLSTKVIIVLAFILGLGITSVIASSPFDIEFPIAELGVCADKASCKTYCDDLSHANDCIAFAKKHGLADERAGDAAKNHPPTGPGGCKTGTECRSYCDNPDHAKECVEFGRRHGLLGDKEAEHAEKIIEKPGPGGCRGKECKTYCENPAHHDECFDFAVKNGFLNKEEAARIKEFKEKFQQSGESPGGCRNADECRAYCNAPDHIDACLRFGEENGLISREDALHVKKAGIVAGPGGCKGKDECRAYCEIPEHQAECIDFAEKNGFMSSEEAGQARKVAGRTGPGGCRADQCRAYCEDPANTEMCLDHAEREGFIPKEDAARARKFMKAAQVGGPGGCKGAECRDYCSKPEHADECFSFAKKQGLISKDEEKQFEAGMSIRKKMEQSGGPGGCETDEECKLYCSDPTRVEECVAFAAAHGGVAVEDARRMLKEFTDRTLEGGNEFRPPEDFRRFEEEAKKRFEEFRVLENHFRGKEFPTDMSGFSTSPGEFPGKPGEFPAGPGRFPDRQIGGFNFVGPGGCSSPAECITYCSEHKEECFSFGPPGRPDKRPPEGGIPPGHEDHPQIRQDIFFKHIPEHIGGRLEECIHGILGPENGRRQLMQNEPDTFFREKAEVMRTCQERLDVNLSMPPRHEDARPGPMPDAEHREPPARDSDGESYWRGELRTNYEVYRCVAGTFGEESTRKLKEGLVRFGEDARAAIARCLKGGTTSVQPVATAGPGRPGSGPCPAMPTVDECPEGQNKVIGYSSPECGTYYTCISAADTARQESRDDASECASHGGSWDGSTCRRPEMNAYPQESRQPYESPPTSAEQPTNEDRASDCAAHGGEWDGSTCRMLETPPPHSGGLSERGFFASIVHFLIQAFRGY